MRLTFRRIQFVERVLRNDLMRIEFEFPVSGAHDLHGVGLEKHRSGIGDLDLCLTVCGQRRRISLGPEVVSMSDDVTAGSRDRIQFQNVRGLTDVHCLESFELGFFRFQSLDVRGLSACLEMPDLFLERQDLGFQRLVKGRVFLDLVGDPRTSGHVSVRVDGEIGVGVDPRFDLSGSRDPALEFKSRRGT